MWKNTLNLTPDQQDTWWRGTAARQNTSFLTLCSLPPPPGRQLCLPRLHTSFSLGPLLLQEVQKSSWLPLLVELACAQTGGQRGPGGPRSHLVYMSSPPPEEAHVGP